MSRIDIAELNDFLHGLRSSNAEAKTMIKQIKEAAIHYTQDNSLKGAAVTTSKQYFSSTYTSIAQSILEALDESEERLAQYIREFGSQVDSSPSSRIDAEVLQEAMAKVSQLRRKEDNLHQQLTAPNTRPDMQQVYTVQSRSVHTQLLEAIEKEQILEKYLAFEQSHGQFFSALDELIRATGRAVQALLQQVTFNEKTGTYSLPTSATNSLLLMNKALQAARKENDKDPFPKAFEDYTLFAYTYVNDQGETVTMWLLERDGKRATNQELQYFLEEHGQELNPLLYTNLSGEELERKVNDSWKEGVNYLNGQKVSGFSGGVLKSSAYVASVKDAMDDAGLTEMTLSLGFGIAAARNKTIMAKKVKEPEVGKISERIKNDSKTVQKNIELSKKAREASKMKEYLKREKVALEKIKKASGDKNKWNQFKNKELLNEHFEKHGSDMAKALNKKNYTKDDYLKDANHVIEEGTYVPELNGYVNIVGGKGSAKYAFVGLDRATGKITTLHLKTVKELAKKAPSLGLKP
ncbi:T7SS effector LXG polymorphic toxin [Listeria welshimeri]|uniref:T7SS effector LXG polymorphic toxin n=1 Tax=Listeria welshimeri TaxID=1643 RepID=UPI002B263D34|nr:T7SS effector LXG polymorphic toxin [Listeria welshimeri]